MKLSAERLLDSAIYDASEEHLRLTGLIKETKKGLDDYRIIQSKEINDEVETKIKETEKEKNTVAKYLIKLKQIQKELIK